MRDNSKSTTLWKPSELFCFLQGLFSLPKKIQNVAIHDCELCNTQQVQQNKILHVMHVRDQKEWPPIIIIIIIIIIVIFCWFFLLQPQQQQQQTWHYWNACSLKYVKSLLLLCPNYCTKKRGKKGNANKIYLFMLKVYVELTHFFVTTNKCMIITGRLCHIMWWRKWHNLLP